MAHELVSPSAGRTYDQPQVVRFGTKYLNQLSHELLSCWLLALHALTSASYFLTILGRGNWILP